MDIGQRKTLAADVFTAIGHLAIEPFQAILRHHLQPRRGFRRHRNPLLQRDPHASIRLGGFP